MSNRDKKRFFSHFESSKEEKDELKKFVKDKGITISQFVRSSIRFFMDKNMIPDKYLLREFDNKSVSGEGILTSFLQNIERQNTEIQESLQSINSEMRDMKNSVTSELFEYLTTIVEELNRNK